MTRSAKGTFIVFEGIDGTGKSTQIELLAETLEETGQEVVVTREPTEGVFGQQIRAHYQNRSALSAAEELELFIKDRREHVETLITPSLEAGKIVLCDRYFLSTAAYQGAAGCSPAAIIARHRFAPEPDLAIIIEVDPRTCVDRITRKRGDPLNDFEEFESLKKVDSIFKQMDLPYVERIDGSVAEVEVHRRVRGLIERLLPHLFSSAPGEHQ
jgi:dTMP kinase